jgi:ferritin-like protein
VAAAGAELSAYHRYTVARLDADQELAAILDDIRTEDRNHYEALVHRIHQLGGRPTADLAAFSAALPHLSPSGPDLVNDLLEAESDAIRRYTAISALTEGRDPWTFRLSQAILREEIEHRSWVREFLGNSVESRFRHGFRGRSPYLGLISATGPSADQED